ncbi:MAG: WG repeat-containing protein [Bacteroidota bacterium]
MAGKTLLLFILISANVFSQDIFPYRKNHLWGYADENGKIIIEPQFKEAGYFGNDGRARVKNDSSAAIINKKGEMVVPFGYKSVFHFAEGLAAVCKGGEINWMQGEIVGGKWGYVNEKGEEVVPFIYDRAYSFENGFAFVQKGGNWGNWGVIDKTGKEILPFVFTTYSFDMRPYPGINYGGLPGEFIKDISGTGDEWVKINVKGKPIGRSYKAIHGFLPETDKDPMPETYIKNGKYGYTLNGVVIVQPVYDYASPFYYGEKYAVVVKNNLQGIVDEKGKEIFPCKFQKIQTSETDLFVFERKDCVPLFEAEYLDPGELFYSEADTAGCKRKTVSWVQNNRGEIIISETDGTIRVMNNGMIKVSHIKLNKQTKRKYRFLNYTGKEIYVTGDFEFIEDNYAEGLIAARKNGKWGYIDSLGNEKIPFRYAWAGNFENGFAEVSYSEDRNYGTGKINKKGVEFFEDSFNFKETGWDKQGKKVVLLENDLTLTPTECRDFFVVNRYFLACKNEEGHVQLINSKWNFFQGWGKYDSVYVYSNSCFALKRENEWAIFSPEGKELVPFGNLKPYHLKEWNEIHDGLAVYEKDTLDLKIINRQGKKLFENNKRIIRITKINESRVLLQMNDGSHILGDTSGNILAEPGKKCTVYDNFIVSQKDKLFGIYNLDGKLLQPFDIIKTIPCKPCSGLIFQGASGKTGIVHQHLFLPAEYDKLELHRISYMLNDDPVNEMCVFAFKNGKTEIWSPRNIKLTKESYDEIVINGYTLKIKQNGKWGVLDGSFNESVPPLYEDILTQVCTPYIVKKKDKWGLYWGGEGEQEGSFIYDSLLPCSGGMSSYCLAQVNGKWGAIDGGEEPAVYFEYDRIEQYQHTVGGDPVTSFVVSKNGKYGITEPRLDGEHKNRWIVELGLYNKLNLFHEGYTLDDDGSAVSYYLFEGITPEGKKEIIDQEGTIVVSGYEKATPMNPDFTDGFSGSCLFAVKENGLYYLCDPGGRISFEYDMDMSQSQPFWNNDRAYIFVYKNKKAGVINAMGHEVIPCEYDKIEPYDDEESGMIRVWKNKKAGMCNNEMQLVIQPEWDKIESTDYYDENDRLYYRCVKKDSMGLFAPSQNKIILRGNYRNIEVKEYECGNLILATKKTGYGLYKTNGELLGGGYEMIQSFYPGIYIEGMDCYFLVRQLGKFGVIGADGKWIVKPEYDSISEPSEECFAEGKKKKEKFCISTDGTTKKME